MSDSYSPDTLGFMSRPGVQEVIDIFINHAVLAFLKGAQGYYIAPGPIDTHFGHETIYIGTKVEVANDLMNDKLLERGMDFTNLGGFRLRMIVQSMKETLRASIDHNIYNALRIGSLSADEFNDRTVANVCIVAGIYSVFWSSPCQGKNDSWWIPPWMNVFLGRADIPKAHSSHTALFPKFNLEKKRAYLRYLNQEVLDITSGIDSGAVQSPSHPPPFNLQADTPPKETKHPQDKNKQENLTQASFSGDLFTLSEIEETEI